MAAPASVPTASASARLATASPLRPSARRRASGPANLPLALPSGFSDQLGGGGERYYAPRSRVAARGHSSAAAAASGRAFSHSRLHLLQQVAEVEGVLSALDAAEPLAAYPLRHLTRSRRRSSFRHAAASSDSSSSSESSSSESDSDRETVRPADLARRSRLSAATQQLANRMISAADASTSGPAAAAPQLHLHQHGHASSIVPSPQLSVAAARVSVCQGKHCSRNGAQALLGAFQSEAAGSAVAVTPCKCLGKCKAAPAVRLEAPGAPRPVVFTCVSTCSVADVLLAAQAQLHEYV